MTESSPKDNFVAHPLRPTLKYMFLFRRWITNLMQKEEFEMLSPYDNFLYALRAKETKRQYPHRLDKFLSYLGLEGTIEEKCSKLYEIAKDANLLYSWLIKFIEFQKQRTPKIILTQEEYDNLKTVFCKASGWSLDNPHTVNVRSITLKGNFKWMPATDVEFHIEIDK